MGTDLAVINPALLALLHGSFNKTGQLQPFVREIMLVECAIAGTSFRELQEVEPLLTVNSLLPLKREPAKEHDALAIMIFDERAPPRLRPAREERGAREIDGWWQAALRPSRVEGVAGQLAESRYPGFLRDF